MRGFHNAMKSKQKNEGRRPEYKTLTTPRHKVQTETFSIRFKLLVLTTGLSNGYSKTYSCLLHHNKFQCNH